MKLLKAVTLFLHIIPTQALQVCLQGPIESLVLLDRLLYVEEHFTIQMEKLKQDNAIPMTVRLVPLFDDFVSPRNVALVIM